MTNTADAGIFPDRTRFNWGFHDAQEDVRAGLATPEWLGRVPSPYAEGYCRGRALAEQGTYQDTSEPAWEAYIAEAQAVPS